MNKLRFLVLLVVLMLACSGCSVFDLSDEDKALEKEYKDKSKVIAKDYIEKKYKINAKIVEVDAEADRLSLGPLRLTGIVFVTMEYNKQTFYVKVSYRDDSESVLGDTYQNQTIKEGWIQELTKIFHQEPKYFHSNLNTEDKAYMEYYYDYYDGTNIENYYLYFEAGFINPNVQTDSVILQLEKLMPTEYQGFGNMAKIYNYKSEEIYKKSQNTGLYVSYGIPFTVYLRDYYVLNPSLKKVNHYVLDIDDANIVIVGPIENVLSVITNYEMESLSDDVLSKFSEENTENVINAIRLDNQDVKFIYLKKSAIGEYQHLQAVFYCKTSDSYDCREFRSMEDYYYVDIRSSNCNEAYIVVAEKK